jgi:hypothetical protein
LRGRSECGVKEETLKRERNVRWVMGGGEGADLGERVDNAALLQVLPELLFF